MQAAAAETGYMYIPDLEYERRDAENYLLHRQTDFTATYMQVSNLQHVISSQPEIITASTAAALNSVLWGTTHNSRRQVFFLFKKAADALAAIVYRETPRQAGEAARSALAGILSSLTGHPFRAAAEATGGLPLETSCPDPDAPNTKHPGIIPVKDLAELTGTGRVRSMQWLGRSLVIEKAENDGGLVVLKFARKGQDLSDLAAETGWMNYLSRLRVFEKYRFDIPKPPETKKPVIYRVSSLAIKIPEDTDIDPNLYAVAFRTSPAYFAYPNHPGNGKMIAPDKCRKVLGRHARVLGHLSCRGIIHTAPIPLFHNRVQQHRRDDRGLYQWRRGGRLDRWLESCRHPNISTNGIRDFEHFAMFEGPARSLYEHIGTHVLSLVLVAGSYCRNHDENRKGLDDAGSPADARDLFDHDWLKGVLAEIFAGYYEGFTGSIYSGGFPRDLDLLSTRLIEEMGVDRHMEEILRAAQQQNMSDPEFRDFLARRGFDAGSISGFKKGEQDITIITGPHLGGFNQRISVPELIEYAACLSAMCIMDRYCGQKLSSAGNSQGQRLSCEESSAVPPC
ncbi:MAG: SidJ-related pseudokinase [Desulfobacterales bacterium]